MTNDTLSARLAARTRRLAAFAAASPEPGRRNA